MEEMSLGVGFIYILVPLRFLFLLPVHQCNVTGQPHVRATRLSAL